MPQGPALTRASPALPGALKLDVREEEFWPLLCYRLCAGGSGSKLQKTQLEDLRFQAGTEPALQPG